MILIVQNHVPHYRKPLFNRLCELDDVLVLHSGPASVLADDRYREVIVPARRVGPFFVQARVSALIRYERPRAVIASADVRNLASLAAMLRFDRDLRWVWWGMDKGKSDMATWAKILLGKRRNAIVFYTYKIRDAFSALGLPIEALFVANNTVDVRNNEPAQARAVRDSFVNVGTLDTRKQNDVLIRAFWKVRESSTQDLFLFLVGEGAERANLEKLIMDLKLGGRVFLTGAIEDPEALRNLYARAIASVSFGQAGLAVLQSMAFGVPFVTKRSAISGGEKDNIVDGHNGFFCEDDEDSLATVMLRLTENVQDSERLGQNAFIYYRENASMDAMLAGFKAALAYTRH